MNQKEYELIAGVIKGRRDNTALLGVHGWSGKDISLAHSIIEDVMYHLSSELAHNYPKTFDINKFLTACGVEDK